MQLRYCKCVYSRILTEADEKGVVSPDVLSESLDRTDSSKTGL